MVLKPLHSLARRQNTQYEAYHADCVRNKDQPHWEKKLHEPQDFSLLKPIETKHKEINHKKRFIYLPSELGPDQGM